MTDAPIFAIGDLVEKINGYRFPGVVTGVDSFDDVVRYIVTSYHPDFYRMKHIFAPEQLQHRTANPETEPLQAMVLDIQLELKQWGHIFEPSFRRLVAAIGYLEQENNNLKNGTTAILPQTKEHALALYTVALASLQSYDIDPEKDLRDLKAEHEKVLAALPPRMLLPVAEGDGAWHYILIDETIDNTNVA